ncbi:MAG TPA: nitroreductase family deazaflavin-dependent oxidoreductase [Nevskiaceae bacterium]|nr:nitroreductase family deazaflavin-dependent oxidoreductase [Nevskiaceae bacterium]
MSEPVPPKPIVRFFTGLNVAIYRLTGGRLMNKMSGCPICLVTMKGAKSGKIKTIALMYTPQGENVLLVASLGGSSKNPVWYHNLKKNPDIEIQVRSSKRKMRAREAGPEEREKLWPVCVASYPPFAEYQTRTTRQIPVFVCEPR